MIKGERVGPSYVIIDESAENQRVDNYLIAHLKGVPLSRIYRAIRQGEVRVNQKRVSAEHRLCIGDKIRIPPLRVAAPEQSQVLPSPQLATRLEEAILWESDELMVINKPAGLPVHGGSGIRTGLIEALRTLRPKTKVLELVHRLDRGTSGCLLIAKKRRMLVELHALLAQKKMRKQYLALVAGQWSAGERRVELPLKKNILRSGERIVRVDADGKEAITRFRPIKIFSNATLVEAQPLTGRTHQIRVHAAHIGHPIAGDEKYGDENFNKTMRSFGLKRMFLHSAGIYCQIPSTKAVIGICGLLDEELMHCLRLLSK